MRGNRPARERFEFSLDARQVASVILGALAALGITFFLGYSLGHRVLERPPSPPPVAAKPPSDPLAALDNPVRPDGGEPAPKLRFHEELTSSNSPAEKLPPPQKPAAPPVPAKAAPAAPPAAGATVPRAQVPPGLVASVSAAATTAAGSAPPSVAAAPALAPPAKGAREGAFAVQVGSTPDRFEAERLALRFRGRGAKVVSADVPGKGRWYRVRVGSFDSREAAERYLRELERDTGSKGYVTSTN
jgi:cell division septation protein DedD